MRSLTELLQQAETLLNRGENAEALGVIALAKQFIEAPDAEAKPAPTGSQALPDLQAQRTAALAAMRAASRNMEAFPAASRQEAELAAQIRSVRRHLNGNEIPLTVEDQYIFQRGSTRQEREYRIADREDAEVLRLRLRFGGIAFNVVKEIDPSVVHS